MVDLPKSSADRSVVIAYVFALAIFAAVGVTAFVYFGRFGESSEWVGHTERVLATLSEGLGEMRDAETGQRGYLLTGDEVFLDPYYRASASVRARFDELARLTADNAAQQERLRALRPLVDEKLAFVDETIDVQRGGDAERARQMVRARRGKQLMDQIRRSIADMEADERTLLAERVARASTNAWLANVFILFGNGIGFAFLAAGTFLLGRELNRRRALHGELDLQRAREALLVREQKDAERLKGVLDEMPVGVVIVDAPDGEITFCNVRIRELFGGRMPDASPRDRYAAFGFLRGDGTPYPAGEHPLERALARGEIVAGEEVQARRLDGVTMHLLASAGPVRHKDGKLVAAVLALDDYSGARRSEEERRQAERFRDLFTGALGHDLRNPLSVISAGAASLLRHGTRPEQTKIASRMASSAERMARMIDQLLDMAQIRLGGGIDVVPKLADLGALARRASERLEVSHPERTIELEAAGDLGGEWDDDRIVQVFTYAIVNALEHGRADTPVRLSLRGEPDRVVAEVHNEGAPIPAELVPLIFDPFQRAAERRRMKSIGLGLGLYLALQIVRAHGGDIEVESTAEAGTTCRIWLPRRT